MGQKNRLMERGMSIRTEHVLIEGSRRSGSMYATQGINASAKQCHPAWFPCHEVFIRNDNLQHDDCTAWHQDTRVHARVARCLVVTVCRAAYRYNTAKHCQGLDVGSSVKHGLCSACAAGCDDQPASAVSAARSNVPVPMKSSV